MEPLRVAVCEDQAAEREALLKLLADSGVDNVPTVFESGEALLAAFAPHAFDLLLMDIYMGGITGVETVERVRRMDKSVPVAFITTSTDYAMESYRLSALMYLEKPMQGAKVREMLELARMKRDSGPALAVCRRGETEKLLLADILFLEQQGRQVLVYLRDGQTVPVYEKLSSLLPQLEGQPFFQTHKSYCVHLDFVQYIDMDMRCFVMANGNNVPIRREWLGRAKRAWEERLFARTRARQSNKKQL